MKVEIDMELKVIELTSKHPDELIYVLKELFLVECILPENVVVKFSEEKES